MAEPDGQVVFSFMVRQRLREAAEQLWLGMIARYVATSNRPRDWRGLRSAYEEMFALVVDRLRHATRQGDAGGPGRLEAEIRALRGAIRQAHAAPSEATAKRVRACLIELVATGLVLDERATRPPELKRGAKSSTQRWRPPKFWMPSAAAVSMLATAAAKRAALARLQRVTAFDIAVSISPAKLEDTPR